MKTTAPRRSGLAARGAHTGLRAEGGFTLAETIVALGLLAGALLGLVGLMAISLRSVSDAPTDLIAKQKASEAIENVFAARDNRFLTSLTWAQIRNVSEGGVFLDGPQPVRQAGPDGLVNTEDDGATEDLVMPGPDNLLGTADDRHTPLDRLTREIHIRDIGPNLREITVTITYPTSTGNLRYVLSTLISSFA